jgi:hypothetical protein
MRRLFLICSVFLLVFLGTLRANTTLAVSIDFEPASQTVNLGTMFDVDVVVSGLTGAGEIISAFDLDVSYDTAFLSATGVSFGIGLGNPNDPIETLTDFDVAIPGVIDFSEISFLSDSNLDALQGDSFTLATLSFGAIGSGTSLLKFDFTPEIMGVPLNSLIGKGAATLALEIGDGNVNVAVPEPASMLLVGSCLIGLASFRKKFKKS